MRDSEAPLVSICCITYNHESYIREAVEGFLNQVTDFKVEIIIHDDCSTDSTTDIIRSYQQQYPRLIKTILQTENQYSKGKRIFPITFAQARGKYLALCEGDDCWTDPSKLSKQVALMEANADYAFCFHPADRFDQTAGKKIDRYISPRVIKEFYTTDDLLEHGNFIPTCSTVFRSELLRDYPEWLYRAGYGDFALYVLVAQRGKIGFVNEPMAMHRFHKAGIWGGRPPVLQWETFIQTYDLTAANLQLRWRDSFKRGFARHNMQLHYAYLRERKWPSALRAVWAALKAAPRDRKPYLMSVLVAQFPVSYIKYLCRRLLSR